MKYPASRTRQTGVDDADGDGEDLSKGEVMPVGMTATRIVAPKPEEDDSQHGIRARARTTPSEVSMPTIEAQSRSAPSRHQPQSTGRRHGCSKARLPTTVVRVTGPRFRYVRFDRWKLSFA